MIRADLTEVELKNGLTGLLLLVTTTKGNKNGRGTFEWADGNTFKGNIENDNLNVSRGWDILCYRGMGNSDLQMVGGMMVSLKTACSGEKVHSDGLMAKFIKAFIRKVKSMV